MRHFRILDELRLAEFDIIICLLDIFRHIDGHSTDKGGLCERHQFICLYLAVCSNPLLYPYILEQLIGRCLRG